MQIAKEDKACAIGIFFGIVLTLGLHDAYVQGDLQKGREEILTGKVVCVQDKETWQCKTKEQLQNELEFFDKLGMVKKQGNPL